MKRVKTAQRALVMGNHFYHLLAAIEDHGELEVLNKLANARHEKDAIPLTQAFHEAATLVDFCQQGRTRVFKEIHENLDSGFGDDAVPSPSNG